MFCKYCNSEIDWILTEEKRYIPVDPEPVFVIEGEGTERFYHDELGVLVGRLATNIEVETIKQKINTPLAYVPHWRTCVHNQRTPE